MKKIIKIENDKIVKNSVNLNEDFPNTSFPVSITQEHLPENYFILHETEKPELDFDEKLVEGPPVFRDGVWKENWIKDVLNEYELLQKQKQSENKIKKEVEYYMDCVVSEKDYTNMISACSYVNSVNEQYSKEAKACIEWRDQIWSKIYQILDDAKKENKEYPKFSDLVKELPTITWP